MIEHEPRRRSHGLTLLLAGGILAGLLMAVATVAGGSILSSLGFLTAGSGAGPTPRPAAIRMDKPAPDFSGLTPAGDTISLSDLRGKPVAINFWATWCAPCLAEMPALEQATARYSDEGLVVLAVNAGEGSDTVRRFMEEQGLSFPALLDLDGQIVDLYGVEFFPTTFWVDVDGMVRAKHLGAMTPELIDDYMKLLIP